MITKPIGVYVHIPYCIRKCNYCDFCSHPTESGVPQEYVDRLINEILSYRSASRIPADTVFFGGGTPSLLSPAQLEKIVSALKLVFDFAQDTEFTIECNPGTVTLDTLLQYKKTGVNRISLGIQSASDSELLRLGRIHTFSEGKAAFMLAKAAGYNNVSCDIMYGLPGQTVEGFRSTLLEILSLNPSHISVYGLMLEEGTPFYKMQSALDLPGEDTEAEMFYLADRQLTEGGYTHYEISNYSLGGALSSRHNLKYWQGSEYIGFGAAAASYYRGQRFLNTSSVSEYLTLSGASYIERVGVDTAGLAFEYVMLRLRLATGISLSEYKRLFGIDFIDKGRALVIQELLQLGLLTQSGDNLALTVRGFYLSNTVIGKLLYSGT